MFGRVLRAKELGDDDEEPEQKPAPFVPYRPTLPAAATAGPPPDDVVESATLSAIPLPQVNYQLHHTLRNSTGFSSLQMEAILLACHTHETSFQNGMRGAFLLGDGTGVGKGRTIVGIIQQNLLHGRKRSIWFSKNKGLLVDAKRDFKDLELNPNHVRAVLGRGKRLHAGDYCLFLTYSFFRFKTDDKLLLIKNWLGDSEDSLIIFDECHCIKNDETHAAKAIAKLDLMFPTARVVYASATAVESASELGYMPRLFLWGPSTAYLGFSQFEDVVKSYGSVGLECIAMELKLRGSYVARRLDYSKATFEALTVTMSKKQIALYNSCVALWLDLKSNLAKLPNPPADDAMQSKGALMRYFWGQHQSFFRQLCLAFKMDYLISKTRRYIKDNCAVIIGIQSTGGWLAKNAPKMTDKLPSNLKEKLLTVILYICQHSELAGSYASLFRRKINQLDLPPNPLDFLVNKLGHQNVVELTGRTGRYEKVGDKYMWRGIYSTRLARQALFMSGTRNIAIISEACSTGISLHADKTKQNQKQRVHITAELPFSAEQVIQQCGRSLRSNQASSPHYKLMVCDCAGEVRFAYGVSKRLEALGAITQGDRSFSINSLDQYSFNSRYVHDSLISSLRCITRLMDTHLVLYEGVDVKEFYSKFYEPAGKALFDLGIVNFKKGSFHIPNTITLEQFFNRLLGMEVSLQNQIFKYFLDVYKATIANQKTKGCYEEGIIDLGKNATLVHQPHTLLIGRTNVELYTLFTDDGVSFERVSIIYNEYRHAKFFTIIKSGFVVDVYLSYNEPNSATFTIVSPLGFRPRKHAYQSLSSAHVNVGLRTAKGFWNTSYTKKHCGHKISGVRCPKEGRLCIKGNRFQKRHVLKGIMWSNLKLVCDSMRAVGIKTLQLVSCYVGRSQIIGIAIPDGNFKSLLNELRECSQSLPRMTMKK